MGDVIQLTPNEWVTADVLSAITGLKEGKIRNCRLKSWRQGLEYILVSSTGEPKRKSEAMYNLPAINKWIAKQAAKQPII
ncbi:excisionase family protein [Limnobaculum xujianqingii]|uniref:excisionase family protein n=1 Tax=Limnobaculum xujianqingii TaxID=2738837 RepID=UPI0011288B08|nr:excisionase family protein [Limnobaculum xujianqingii]